jgi:hypothetical protein
MNCESGRLTEMADFAVVGMTEFMKDIDNWKKREVPRKFALGMRKIGLTALTRFVERTPVGNPELWESPPPVGYTGGRARGNWQASINIRPEGESKTTDASGANTVTKGFAVIESLPASQAIGAIIYLTNNVPYISRLEEGHSSQAPAGTIVALTIAELRTIFNEF